MSEQSFQQPNQIDLKSIDTFQLIELLKKYNHKFGMGASMARMLGFAFNRQETVDDNQELKDKESDNLGSLNVQNAE